jgi:cysteine-rich repeat protein
MESHNRQSRLGTAILACSAFVAIGWGAPTAHAACGDGTVQTGEECDDGNTRSWDGCSPACKTESSTVLSASGIDWKINGATVQLWGVRTANAIHDQTATDDLIEMLGVYQRHGIESVSISVQGGRTGNSPNTSRQYDLFNADGTLKSDGLARLRSVLDALDARGMAACVVYFYQERDQGITIDDTSNRYLFAAIDNLTRWLTDEGYRNVFVDVANEHAHGGFDHAILANATESNRDALCDRVTATNGNFLCSVSPLSGSYAYDVTLVHNAACPTPASIPCVTNEMLRRDDYDDPGVFTSSEIADTKAEIETSKARRTGYFLHAAWIQGVYEDGADVGPRFSLGGDGTSASPGVHWMFDHVAAVEGIPDPEGGGATRPAAVPNARRTDIRP